MYQIILGKLLVGIEPQMSEPIAHYKPPTTRLHTDGCMQERERG
jgi:hypothetical protein